MKKIAAFLISLSLVFPFISKGQKAKAREPKVAYLAAYMKGKDEKHLYYAIAEKDFLFKEINAGRPVLSTSFDDQLIRDPMVFRDTTGIYHLVATVSWKNRPFTIWDSKDLIYWENERLIDVAPENASKTWAPEIGYDRKGGQYFAYWTGEVNKEWNTASIYYATTNDFIHFSEPQILLKDSVGILDANLIFVSGVYHLFTGRIIRFWWCPLSMLWGPIAIPASFLMKTWKGRLFFR